MLQTTAVGCPAPSVTFDEGAYSSHAVELQKILVVTGLVWGLYGVLAVLAVLSVCAFTRRSTSRTRGGATSIILRLTILALVASTTIFSVNYTLFIQSLLLTDYIKSGRALWTASYGAGIEYPTDPLGLVKDYSALTDCGCTAALMVNIILGDAIVCWRACTIWYNNRLVKMVCSLLVLATAVLAGVSTAKGCHHHPVFGSENFVLNDISFSTQFGAVQQGIPSAVAASILSLSTNLLATLLVGYKAWKSRRRLKGYLVAGSQTEKLFSLLIESGAIYCTIWGFMVAYEITQYRRWALGLPVSAAESNFIEILTVTFGPALLTLVAIYPMIIIVLVALNRSHMEKGLLPEHLQSLPTPNIAFTVNTAITMESELCRRSEVFGTDPDEHREYVDSAEDGGTRASEECKAIPVA